MNMIEEEKREKVKKRKEGKCIRERLTTWPMQWNPRDPNSNCKNDEREGEASL